MGTDIEAATVAAALVDVTDTLRRDKSGGVVLPSAKDRLVGRANCHACFLPPPRHRPRRNRPAELIGSLAFARLHYRGRRSSNPTKHPHLPLVARWC